MQSLVLVLVRLYLVHSQGVARFASFLAHRTGVGETTDVRFNVLLHSRPDLGGEMALGTLPRGFPDGGVVVGDHQLRHLPVQLEVHLSWHLANHLGSLFPWSILLLLLLLLMLWLELHPPTTSSSHWTLMRSWAMAWA